ncbi:hypothetical protein BCR34DRAFT_584996 [Clohesyomyces aquaticus]|uniref:HMG box domain-containing protein n=1 Tax=Clohesyomyces aquaticus TaxID=1231657 RepID=A0A1Y1ZZW7_9PLEO|nr:hypothetical protein BCR34DRAFT_584996 [Clohesyomyces aquaticus]
MMGETVIQQHPPTPPRAGTEHLQSELCQIAQYNAEQDHPYDGTHRHGSAYGSPVPVVQQVTPEHSFRSSHPSQLEGDHYVVHQDQGFGLGIQYEGYGQGPAYYPQEGDYHNGMVNNHAIYPRSPPTPASATDNDTASRRTRSGCAIALSNSPGTPEKPRPKATTKSKKAKAGKGDKPKMPKLTAPLSVLTKDMENVPVRDMQAWVNRPVEVRLKEVEKRNGYVTRPMNSFMLYRSAFAERTKHWCLQNNHQIVSSVSGESWPLEPPEVRELYNEYAKIERINHQSAHPTYKFTPSKATALARKRKGDFSDEELSDVDDGEWGQGNRRSRTRAFRRPERSLTYSPNSIGTDFYHRSFGPHGHAMDTSAWEMTNDGRPLPMPIQGDIYNSYHQTSVHPSMAMPPGGVEDLRMRRVDSPVASMQFSSGPLLGLPGGNTVDLMESLHSSSCSPLGEPRVDPMLLAFSGDHHQHHDVDPIMAQHSEFGNGHLSMIERELDQESVHSLLGGVSVHDNYHAESWHPDPTIAAMEKGSEFDNWMDDHHRN